MNRSSDMTLPTNDNTCESHAERRERSDRRAAPTGVRAALPPAGRRMAHRRADEHRKPYFVDRFSAWMFAFTVFLPFASVVDALLPLYLIQAGGEEVNPVMQPFIEWGESAFVLGKYAMTVIGIPLLLIFKNHYLFGGRFRIVSLIPAVDALYTCLIVYQVYLIHACVGWWW